MRFDPGIAARRAIPAAALGALLVTSAASAASINFDTFPNGTAITTQYQSQGVVFSSNGGGPATIAIDVAEATSQPNVLVGSTIFSNIYGTFVDPATGLATSLSTACGVSLKVISAGFNVVHLRSRGVNNAVLEDFTVTNPNTTQGGLGNVDPIAFTVGPIKSFEMEFTVSSFGDGIGIDDLIFDLCSTPAKASSWGAVKGTYR